VRERSGGRGSGVCFFFVFFLRNGRDGLILEAGLMPRSGIRVGGNRPAGAR
jgi:hypothetical protein